MFCVIGACLSLLGLPAMAVGEAPAEHVESLKLALSPVPIKGILKLDHSVNYATEPPGEGSQAYLLRAKGRDIVLVDANDDGMLDEEHDWMTLGDEKMLVPYSPTVFFSQGMLRIVSMDKPGKILACEFVVHRDLNGNVYESMAFLNRIRLRNGMAGLSLDLAMCKACDQHSDYVAAHGNTGMGLHSEKSGQSKYSAEGAAAAAGSSIYPMKSDLRSAMDGWMRSAWHAWPLMDPATKFCGVTNKGQLCMFYRDASHTYRTKGASFVYPGADGYGLPLAFNVAEIPTPVPGKNTGTLGMPVMWRAGEFGKKECSMSLSTRVKGKEVAVEGYSSSPAKPSNAAEWPSNSGLHLFIPARPLRADTEYFVTIRSGEDVIVESRFTTGGSADFLGTVNGSR